MISLLIATALAQSPSETFDGRIHHELSAGHLSEHEALWLSYLQVFEPDELPEAYREEQYGWLCGTGVVQQLKLHWEEFTPIERARITRVLTPWQDDLLQDTHDRPPAPPADGICWSQQGANVFRSDHFQIEWDSGFSNSQADAFARSLELAYNTELADGWREPEGMNNYLLQVYVSNQNYAGAYTTVALCGGTWMPYIVAGRGSFAAGAWYQTMAAHEFNHASQYGYSDTHQFWFWEATATYVEESVVPNLNDWASPIEAGFVNQTWMSMHASSQDDQNVFWHMYGMAVWLFYLDEHVGGPQLVRDMWEYSDGHGSQYALWQDDALAGLGYDFQEVYDGFIVNNTVMDFAEQDAFPRVNLTELVSAYPASGEVTGVKAPQSRGQNYIKLATTSTANEDLPDLEVSFTGAAGGEWTAWLVGTSGGQVADQVRFDLIDNTATARLERMDDFDDAWLVVSPMVREDQPATHFGYTWSAARVEKLPSGLAAVCGCQSSPTPSAWLMLIPALLWRRRRN